MKTQLSPKRRIKRNNRIHPIAVPDPIPVVMADRDCQSESRSDVLHSQNSQVANPTALLSGHSGGEDDTVLVEAAN